jgi:hypothetical protein
MNNLSESTLARSRQWHGSIDDQFGSIDNVLAHLKSHEQAWAVPPDMLTELYDDRNRVSNLIDHCRTTAASTDDRNLRNALLKSTVGYCLVRVKLWAYGQYSANLMTADDVHELGFLLPGETAGHRDRSEATDTLAEVKVSIISADFIRVVIDRSSGENAAQVTHGWPTGVRNALIVIVAADGETEVNRLFTTQLHNYIKMPAGSHGKQFIIKAAFLKHVNDEPRFGNEPTFSMPLTTEDLAAAIDRQHHEAFEEQIREVEKQRLETEP